MLSLTKPTRLEIDALLHSQAKRDFSYSAVGATASEPPAGYVRDHTRVLLGHGAEVFEAARASLRQWRQFDQSWLEICWPDTPLEAGNMVAVLARALGIWSLNACRIVYVVDQAGPEARFGLAYGTLPGHAESGEERFVVEHLARDDSVWYDVQAFSRPRHMLARLGYPYVRRLQRRFAQGSGRAMQRAVSAHCLSEPSTSAAAHDVTLRPD